MKYPRRHRTAAAAASALAFLLAGGAAGAQTPHAQSPRTPAGPTPEQRRQAGAAFDSGMAARASRDFANAATYFETADRLAPAAPALGNAIEAHRALRTPAHNARAATLALRLLARHSSDARLSAYANHIIEELAPGLERVDVACHGCDLEVDSVLMSYSDFFVEPGAHNIVATWSGNRTRAHQFTAERNGTEEVTLFPPAETTTVAAAG